MHANFSNIGAVNITKYAQTCLYKFPHLNPHAMLLNECNSCDKDKTVIYRDLIVKQSGLINFNASY